MALRPVVFNSNTRIEFNKGTSGTSLIYLNGEVFLPTVTTSSISNITTTSASGGGNVTDQGTTIVTSKGIQWSLYSNFSSIAGSTNDGSGLGSYTSNLTSLSPNTTYYVRAYATNSIGTGYGSTVSFTTLINIQSSSILFNDGGSPTKVYAYFPDTLTSYLLTVPNITSSSADIAHTSNKMWLQNSIGGSILEWNITLSPWNATYNRSISNVPSSSGLAAINDTKLIGISYPNVYECDITTTTSSNTLIFNTLISGRSISGDYILTTTNKLIVTASGYVTQYDYPSGVLDVDISISGTIGSPYGLYEYNNNIYISNGDGKIYLINKESPYGLTLTDTVGYSINGASQLPSSLTVNFIAVPKVITTAISSITTSSASSGGNVTTNGGATVTSRGVCWSTSSNPTITNSHTTDGSGTGSFTSSLTSLSSNTTYYVRAYATNSAGTGYGNQISFTTSSVTVVVPSYLHYTTDYITKVVLSDDGSKLYLTRAGGTYTYVEQYALAATNYIGDKTLTTSFSFTAGVYDILDRFSPDGVYAFCTNGFVIKRYTLSTAWNISTLQLGTVQSYNAGSYFNTSSSMSSSFNSSGTYMTLSTIYNSYIRFVVFSLGSAYSLASVTYSSVGTSNGTVSAVAGFEYNSDGTKMYIMNSFNLASILEYNVSGSAYQPSLTQTFNVSYNYTYNMDTTALARDFCLSADKHYVYIVSAIGSGTQTLAQFVFGKFSTVFINDPSVKVAYLDCTNHGTITSNSLIVRMGVTDNGYDTVSQSGLIWSTSNTSPTFLTSYTNSMTDGGSGIHNSCVTVTGLSPSTTYYIRAWSLNSVGYSYSTTYSFTTLAGTTTTTTTQVGAGYYDCGYGCQYYTYNPGCTACVTSVYISNYSLDTNINNVTINGTSISSAVFPVGPDGTTNGTTTQFGSYTITVNVSGISTTNISVTDSNNVLSCQTVTGAGDYTFFNQAITVGTSVTVSLSNGSCV